MESEPIPDCVAELGQQQLVLVTGLDIANNELHSTVFRTFTHTRDGKRASVRYMLLDSRHTFRNTRRPSIVSSGSRGFIKVDWLSKYVEDIPAVIILFADFDWDNPSWSEKITECESKINSLRSGIGKYQTRICIVLLQRSNVSPLGDNPLATERATKLCYSCQLPVKQLFVLPIGDHMSGYVSRLEIAIQEHAQWFYQQRFKSIRAVSIPNNASNLIIRQQFKLAFLSELRQDTHVALRHYKLAYQHCTECEIVDSELYELRFVAGLLNYKICQLSFSHDTALEAIEQQRRHMSAFFGLPPGYYPSHQLAQIEHFLWVSQQCSLFAILFERAITNGLVAIATQNPGLYLQTAANYCRMANDAIVNAKSSVDKDSVYPTPDLLMSNEPRIFYGQRPWRVAVDGGGLADEITEKNAAIALLIRCKVNHERCINILVSAISQFRHYKCLRLQRLMRLHLVDEQASIGQHSEACKLASHLISEFRADGFKEPIAVLLKRCLYSAYLIADIREYMAACMQMVNVHAFPCLTPVVKHIFANIASIRNGSPPYQPLPAQELTQEQISASECLWQSLISKRVFFTLDARYLELFVRARAVFLINDEQPRFQNAVVPFMVAFKSYMPSPFMFDGMKIIIENTITQEKFIFKQSCVNLSDKQETVLLFALNVPKNTGKVEKFIFKSLALELGTVNSVVYGTIEWDTNSISAGFIENAYGTSLFDPFIGRSLFLSAPSEAKCRIESVTGTDVLVGEIATMTLCLIYEESKTVHNLVVNSTINKQDVSRTNLKFVNDNHSLVDKDCQQFKYRESHELPLKIVMCLRLYASDIGSDIVEIHVEHSDNGTLLSKNFSFPVHVRSPFNMKAKILTINNEVIDNPPAEIGLFFKTNIEVNADISFAQASWNPGSNVVLESDKNLLLEGCQLLFSTNEVHCTRGEALAVCAPIHFTKDSLGQECSLGTILLRWRRQSSNNDAWVVSQLELAPIISKGPPISISLRVATSKCVVRTAIPIIYTIRNLCDDAVDLQLSLEPANFFMFAGNKKIGIRLTPSDCYEYNVTVVALSSGRLALPKLSICSSTIEQSLLNDIASLSTPETLFVQLDVQFDECIFAAIREAVSGRKRSSIYLGFDADGHFASIDPHRLGIKD